MVELITNLDVVSKELGVDVKKRYLSVALNYDGYKAVAPKVVKRGNEKILIARHIEMANVEAQREIEKTLPKDIKVVYYNPYFTFEIPKEPAYSDFIDAFISINRTGETIAVHDDLPLQIYQWLEKNYELKFMSNTDEKVEFYMYEIAKEEVLSKFELGRKDADKTALSLIEKSPIRAELNEYIEKRKDTRFEVLDELMDEAGLKAVLCTSPLGVQEITGYGMVHHQEDGIAALYVKGENKVYIFAKKPLSYYSGDKKIKDIAKEVYSLTGDDVIGIEEQHFSLGWFNSLGFKNLNLKNAMNVIKISREKRAWEDLSYYIIAARASVYATEGALEWTKAEISKGNRITECDVENKYIALLEEFRKKNNISLSIRTFWTNCHAGARSIFPSLATDYVLTKDFNTLKIDAGVSLVDENGIHRAASDIARTATFKDNCEKAYKKFDEYMVKTVIPNVKPGMNGNDIYKLAVSEVQKELQLFKDLSLMPDVRHLSPIFNRDVGHLMALQEPVTLFFKKDAFQVVEEGMVGAIEYQWPIDGNSIGAEDIFLIGPNGGLNFTRDDL